MVTTVGSFRHFMYDKYPNIVWKKIAGENAFLLDTPLPKEEGYEQFQRIEDGKWKLVLPIPGGVDGRAYKRFTACPTTLASFNSWLVKHPEIKELERHRVSYDSPEHVLLYGYAKDKGYLYNDKLEDTLLKQKRAWYRIMLTNVDDGILLFEKVPYEYNPDTRHWTIVVKATTYLPRKVVEQKRRANSRYDWLTLGMFLGHYEVTQDVYTRNRIIQQIATLSGRMVKLPMDPAKVIEPFLTTPDPTDVLDMFIEEPDGFDVDDGVPIPKRRNQNPDTDASDDDVTVDTDETTGVFNDDVTVDNVE